MHFRQRIALVLCFAFTLIAGCGTDTAPYAGLTGIGTTTGPSIAPAPTATAEPSGDSDGGVNGTAADGSTCDRDRDCESNHCRNGVCCAGGECCRSADDCGDGSGSVRTCDKADECQGTMSKLACTDFRCKKQSTQDDDRACNADVQANGCGPYKPVMCNGKREQRIPECPTSCASDNDCDDTAQCTDGACVDRRLPTGDTCNADSQCISGVCADGRCCRDQASCAPDAGSATQTDEDRMRCLDVVVPGALPYACRQCACDRCASAALDCVGNTDFVRAALCTRAANCAFYSGCTSSCTDADFGCFGGSCFCGAGNAACDLPLGRCVDSIATAAGGTRSVEQVRESLRRPDNALHSANSYTECLVRECRATCGF